ncbi:MAG: YitT family protein [Oscillospiraceae bacterium]|nr:YitT family protein [Oscillospiraceae bacterium]
MKRIRDLIIDLLQIAFGSAVFSLGVHCFISSNDIAPGGATGAAIILSSFFPVGVGTLILIVNIPLLILGFILLNRGVMLKTLFSVALVTLFTDLAELYVPIYDASGGNGLIAAIFGGALIGAGMGVIYSREATSGGSDILTKIIGKYFPQYRLGLIQAVIDTVVVTAGFLVFGNLNDALLAVVAIFIQSVVIDRIIYGGRESRLMLIFSQRNEDITQKIIRADHGLTILKGTGAFSREEQPVLMTAVRRHSYAKIKRIVNEIDPDAFVITTNADEVLGLGFEKLG